MSTSIFRCNCYSWSGLMPYVSVKEAIGDLPSLFSKESASRYNKPASCEYQKLMRSKSRKFDCHIAPNHPTNTIEKIKSTKPVNQCIQDLNKG